MINVEKTSIMSMISMQMNELKSCNSRNYNTERVRERERESVCVWVDSTQHCNLQPALQERKSAMMRRDISVYAFPPSKKAKPRLPSFSFIFPCQIAEHWESIHHRETPVTARIILSPSSPWNPRNLCMEFIDLFPSHCYYFNGSSCMHLCVGSRLSFLLHLLI